jgi:hypothetical protein
VECDTDTDPDKGNAEKNVGLICENYARFYRQCDDLIVFNYDFTYIVQHHIMILNVKYVKSLY